MSLSDRLRAPDPDDRLAAIAEAGATGATPEERAALVACLGHERKAVRRRAAEALAALAARGVPVRDLVTPVLGASSGSARFAAAYALARLGEPPPALLPVLVEALGEEDGDVRWAAATIVVRMKGEPGLEPTLCDLAQTGTAAQRKMALYCLRDLTAPGDAEPAVVETVLGGLGDPVATVRLAAMATLPAVATDRADAALRLLPNLEDVDEGVRRAAAAALGKLGAGSGAVLGALDRAAASDDPALRRAAGRALALLRE